MYYFIYAYPDMYGGRHGMYNSELVECNDFEEACECGYELAYETVESYLRADEIYSQEDFMKDFYDDAEWNDSYNEEYWDAFDEVMQDQCGYEIYTLKDGVTKEDYDNWLKENMPPEDFIKRYCKPI